MTTDLEEFRCTSTGGAPHHLSFAGVQLETTAEHPVTDGVHTVRNPDRKAFILVCQAVTVDLLVISIHMVLESMCLNDALRLSLVHRDKERIQNRELTETMQGHNP